MVVLLVALGAIASARPSGLVLGGVILWIWSDPRRGAGPCEERNGEFEFLRDGDAA